MYKNWHSHEISKIFSVFRTSDVGFSSEQAARKIAKGGRNVLPEKKQFSRLKLFFNQFNSPLIYILLTAVVISFSLGHISDSVFIVVVLLINTIVGFYQENKANNSLAALEKMVKVRARVLRDDQEQEIDSEMIVPGDIIILKAGDKVPADCRIISSKELNVNEASLTGESVAILKEKKVLEKDTLVTNRKNMVFAGTSVESGEAKVVVVATGISTELGKIVGLVKHTEEPKTPLQKKIDRLSKLLGAVILFFIAIIVIEGFLTGKGSVDIFISALALAVSAIPEGLLPAITVVLVFAMRRILKKKGVVKKLSAAEGLGSVTTVCTDKTGTLTEGKMQVRHIFTRARDFLKDPSAEKVFDESGGQSDIWALEIATLTNDAYIENPQDNLGEWIIRGHFTDKALLVAGIQAGLNVQSLENEHQEIGRLNFNSHLRFGATFRKDGEKKRLFVVGAPEEIIRRSNFLDAGKGEKEIEISKKQKNWLFEKLEELASQGLRVVACAHREIKTEKQEKNLATLAEKLVLTGFIALKDPVRKDVQGAMQRIKNAGIRPVIITGDHKLTAKAVASEIGLKIDMRYILEGRDIEKMSDSELQKKANKISIYARALPEHKLRIVNALHGNNEVVAMFGDGVNDAPALKAADIGVAVGSGTDVTKEVADVILLDDNFKVIVKAIEQGRVAFENIRKVFIYLVADDFSEIILFFGAMFLGLPFPLLAAQILWINLIEDGLPDIALTTEQEIKGVMHEKPRDPDEPILSPAIKKWMFTIFSINGLVTLCFFCLLYKANQDIEKTRTVVFALVAFDSLVLAYSVRSLRRTIFRRDIFSNHFLNGAVMISFALLVLAIYLPVLQNFLGTVPLGSNEWLMIVVITIFETIMFEIGRRVFLLKKTS